jgi:anthranilate synthase component 1
MTILQRRFDCFPDLLALHRLNPDRYPFLLESVSHNTSSTIAPEQHQSRWDILFAFPGQRLELSTTGQVQGDAPMIMADSMDFLNQLDNWWRQETIVENSSISLPFTGGWFLYLSYELAGQIESVLHLPGISGHTRPQAMAVRCPAAILRDHEQQCTFIISEAAYGHYLETMAADLQHLADSTENKTSTDNNMRSFKFSNDDFHEEAEEQFLKAVEKIKDYIHEGDVFQVNLSRCWKGQLPENIQAADLYQTLRQYNPAPFAGLCVQQDWAIISSSPERLVCVDRERNAETRPIAGTRPRHGNQADDYLLSQELLHHPKERAEHIMLIDMERNDLGRVCQAGTIVVNELMVLESYTHVHHIVSNVRGHLREDVTPGKVIRAVFPGGTITGCPKVRCMEIIAELEQDERGPYTGSMGYLNLDGSLDLNILIRTLSLNEQELSLRAGAGIVADSIPIQELAETRAKARGLLLALGSL